MWFRVNEFQVISKLKKYSEFLYNTAYENVCMQYRQFCSLKKAWVKIMHGSKYLMYVKLVYL